MIYFIEGMTCAGKTTLAKKIAQEKGWIYMSEHTPAPPGNCSMIERQDFIFNDFLSQFEEMLLTPNKIYIADFSPAGPIPFNLALSDMEPDPKLKKMYIDLANKYDAKLKKKFKEWGEQVQRYEYLSISAKDALQRLQKRARIGDDVWTEAFLKALSKEYDKYFKQREG